MKKTSLVNLRLLPSSSAQTPAAASYFPDNTDGRRTIVTLKISQAQIDKRRGKHSLFLILPDKKQYHAAIDRLVYR